MTVQEEERAMWNQQQARKKEEMIKFKSQIS